MSFTKSFRAAILQNNSELPLELTEHKNLILRRDDFGDKPGSILGCSVLKIIMSGLTLVNLAYNFSN